jgi:hypothetical protein
MSKARKLTLAGGLLMLAGMIGLLTTLRSDEGGSLALSIALVVIGIASLASARKQNGRG